MTVRMNAVVACLVLGAALGCVPKKQLMESEDRLKASDENLQKTLQELDATKSSLAELQGLQPELAAKDEALQSAQKQLEEARARLDELNRAQAQMEESLKQELQDKTIRIENLKGRLTVTFVDKILFDSGSDKIKPAGQASLLKVAKSLKEMVNHGVHVVGHTDNVNLSGETKKKFATNWELSTARATAVVRLMQDSGGIPPERLFAEGRAFYRPMAPNDTPEGRASNRRVEIVLRPME